MYDSAKYLIHADIRASGVVERSDVVGAVFGQTEGLLGDDLDLRELQESGKLGRIDVEVESERGSSFGDITIASGLDRVQTAILAAALETIDRVGPCRADVEIRDIEDVRSAKRREVVERAKELLADFDERTLSSEDIVEEVRLSVRVEDITEYEGLPAGPRVADSDAVVVVEGRSDVLTLLQYGVKNAVAVEGTDVPEAVAELTADRTVTAFLDGDRGGDLILQELSQIGDVDYVALAPSGRSVEDLSRSEVMSALREKVPLDAVTDEGGSVGLAATDGSARPAPDGPTTESDTDAPASPDNEADSPDARVDPPDPSAPRTPTPDTPASPSVPDAESEAEAPAPTETNAAGTDSSEASSTDRTAEPADADSADGHGDPGGATAPASAAESAAAADSAADAEAAPASESEDESGADAAPQTLADHVEAVVGGSAGRARLLDGDCAVLDEGGADEAFDLVEGAETVPTTVVLDGEVSQRLLDVAAQRGVEQVVARSTGEFVKQPATVRIRTAEEF